MSAIDEVMKNLKAVEYQLEQTNGYLLQGEKLLQDSRAALASIDPDNPNTVIPEQLHKALRDIEYLKPKVEQALQYVWNYASML